MKQLVLDLLHIFLVIPFLLVHICVYVHVHSH